MHKFHYLYVLCSTIALLASSTAMAGSNWNGKYVGINIGSADVETDVNTRVLDGTYFIGSDAAQITPQASPTLSDSSAFNGSLSLGYNQRNNNYVFGVEADATFLNYDEEFSSGSIEYLTFPGGFFQSQTKVEADWMASLRGRVGIVNNNILFYATAGVAVTDLDYEHVFTDTVAPQFSRASGSDTVFGWTAGLGAEWQLEGNWSVKAEYRYTRFNDAIDENSSLPNSPTEGFDNNGDLEINNFQIGFIYSF